MSALRTVVNFARDKGLIESNPFYRVKLGAYEEEERVALSEEDLDRVLLPPLVLFVIRQEQQAHDVIESGMDRITAL